MGDYGQCFWTEAQGRLLRLSLEEKGKEASPGSCCLQFYKLLPTLGVEEELCPLHTDQYSSPSGLRSHRPLRETCSGHPVCRPHPSAGALNPACPALFFSMAFATRQTMDLVFSLVNCLPFPLRMSAQRGQGCCLSSSLQGPRGPEWGICRANTRRWINSSIGFVLRYF